MRYAWLFIFAFSAIPCSLACAASAGDLEGVAIALPGDFQLANQQRDAKAGLNLAEYVRKGDTLEDWDELLTVQSFALKRWGGGSPDEVLEATRRAREQACPDITTWNVIARDAHRVVYEWHTSAPCMGQPPQREIAVIAVGKLERFRIAYTTKASAIAARDRALWVQVLETSFIYYKDALVWGHPRNDPPAFVRDMLATGQWKIGAHGISAVPFLPDAELAFIEATHAEDRLQFIRKYESNPVTRFQELDRTAIEGDFSLEQWNAKVEARIQARQDQDCPGGYTKKQILREPGRIVEEQTFRSCKKGPDEQRITLHLLGDQDLFIWVDAVRPAWTDESQRRQIIESAMNVRLAHYSEAESPAN